MIRSGGPSREALIVNSLELLISRKDWNGLGSILMRRRMASKTSFGRMSPPFSSKPISDFVIESEDAHLRVSQGN